MKTQTIIIWLFICFAAVLAEREEGDDETLSIDDKKVESIRRVRDFASNEMQKRRRKRQGWHSNYGHHYPSYGWEDRRDYAQNNELYAEILRLLEDIKDSIRRPPPPPPQPIYVPYAVPYPVPNVCKCVSSGIQPNITDRFPVMEDTNQNWGFVNEETPTLEGDGSRPISFDPIPPPATAIKPQPSVEHGSSQAGKDLTTRSPARQPTECDAAVLTCCVPTKVRAQQRRCFQTLGCEATYRTSGCTPNSIATILDIYASQYAAV